MIWRINIDSLPYLTTMEEYKLTAVIWREDVGYVSKCSELGVASAGDTVEEALENLKEAVHLYLENAKELGSWMT